MGESDQKEGWAPKNWCFQTVLLEKTLERSLDSKEIKPINPKGNQLWIFIGRTDAEVPILWPPDAKSQIIGKDPHAGGDWGQEEKEATEDVMTGWHHWLNGHEFEQTPKDNERLISLAFCLKYNFYYSCIFLILWFFLCYWLFLCYWASTFCLRFSVSSIFPESQSLHNFNYHLLLVATKSVFIP